MARFRKPFFRPSRGVWYVWHDGRQVNLGPDEDAAHTRWHELQAQPKAVEVDTDRLVVVVVDEFLTQVKQTSSPHTYRWYHDRLQLFVKAIPATLTLDDLKPHHVQKWINGYPDLSSGSKRNYCRSIIRAMNWAEEQGYVERSPLAHFKKPAGGKKEQVVTAAEFQMLLDRTTDEEFKDLLTVTWETGCRPQESLRVEARHVDLVGERWFFPASESKGKKQPRVVYLTPASLEITRRLVEKNPKGPLFLNTDGVPWTTDAINCRFCRVLKQKSIKYSLYSLRHSWIQRMLLSGCDAFTVAHLAGHSDPSMLARHYAHLSQAPDFLREQMRRLTG